MVTQSRKGIGQRKKDEIIDLTDYGNHNPVRAGRLPYAEEEDVITYNIPGIGIKPERKSTANNDNGSMRSVNDPSNSTAMMPMPPIVFASAENSNKELQNEEPLPQDPEPHYLEQLDAEGRTILKSETYFPASKQIVTRSQTVEERKAQKEREWYDL